MHLQESTLFDLDLKVKVTLGSRSHKMLPSTLYIMWSTCVHPGIFVRGVQVSLIKKSSDNLTTLFFSSAYFTEVKWSISKKSIIFQCPRGGPPFSWGSNFSRGVQLLIPYRNPYNLSFSRGVRTPCPPLWIRTWPIQLQNLKLLRLTV